MAMKGDGYSHPSIISASRLNRDALKFRPLKDKAGMKTMANDPISDAFRIPDRANGEKKSVYLRFTCRSAASAAMLRQAMEDRAAIDGIPVYSAFEDALMEASLPKDAFARHFALLVLGEQAGVFEPLHEGVSPVQHALHDAFETLADFDNGFWKLPKTKLLVSFASEYAEVQDLTVTPEDDFAHEIASALAAVHLKVVDALDTLEASILAGAAPEPLLEKGDVLDTFDGWLKDSWSSPYKGYCIILSDLFRHLADAWEDAWTIPGVSDLVLTVLEKDMCHGSNTAKERKEFEEVCRAVMPAWSVELARRGMEMEEERVRSMTKKCTIKGGTLNCPTTWKIANPEEAPECEHAARVSVVNAVAANSDDVLGKVDETTRIVLLPCPFEDLGDTDEEKSQRVIEMAAESWTDLPKILDAKVELKRAENGKPLNWDEWKTSLRVNVSKVPKKVYGVSAAANGYAAWIDEDPDEDL